MKIIKKSILALFSLIVLFSGTTQSVVVQSSTSASGGKDISATAYQLSTGKFFAAYATGGSAQDNIASFSPVTGTTVPSPTSFVSSYYPMSITYLGINSNGQVVWTTNEGSSADRIYVSEIVRDGSTYTPWTPVSVPSGTISSDPLEVYAYAPDLDAKIRGLAVSDSNAFVAVNAQLPSVTVDWLSGTSSHIHSYDLPAAGDTTTTPSLEDSEQLTREVGGGFAIGSALASNADAVALAYAEIDAYNKRLYVGTSVTAATGGSNGARSIIVYKVDSTGDLYPLNLKANPNASWGIGNSTATNSKNNIIGVLNPTVQQLAVHHLGVMKTTQSLADTTAIDGLPYLIISGGNGEYASGSAANGNFVWAVPLVASQGSANDIVGTLADKTVATHYTQADGSLTLTNASDRAAQVGGGTLPDSWPKTLIPTHMIVQGDAVFVSGAKDDGSGFPGGIYVSRARHKPDGRIYKWTKWQKAASNTLGASSTDGGVQFFGLSKTGKFWAVGSTDKTKVRYSEWHTRSTQQIHPSATDRTYVKTVLPGTLNTTLHMRIESDLTLPAHYVTLYKTTNGAITLGSAYIKEYQLPYPQYLPGPAAIASWTDNNYFLVGTANGLMALRTDAGAGAADADLLTSNIGTNTFFSTASFQLTHSSYIDGIVLSLAHAHTSGALYVLSVKPRTSVYSVHRIKPDSGQNILHASATPIKIAEVGPLNGLPGTADDSEKYAQLVRAIHDIAILDHDGTNESLIMGTNTGAWVSKIDTSGSATGSHNAARAEFTWKPVSDARPVYKIERDSDGHASRLLKGSALAADWEWATLVTDPTDQANPILDALVDDDSITPHAQDKEQTQSHFTNGFIKMFIEHLRNQIYTRMDGYPYSYKTDISTGETAFNWNSLSKYFELLSEKNGVTRIPTQDSSADVVLD